MVYKNEGKNVECPVCGGNVFYVEVFQTTKDMAYIVCNECHSVITSMKFN